ncbi:high-affinity iron permease [Irineochytrium annulatum]|nr:high-affinity iron permease [Irineochytrium annulatum]
MFGFSIPIYFVLFREATEAAIVVSVLITFIMSAFRDRKDIRTVLMRQVWFGTVAGIIVSLAIGAAFIVVWFKYASNLWATAEPLWEGIFSLIASLLMTIMAIAFLRSDQLTNKWHRKLNKALAETDEFGHVIREREEADRADAGAATESQAQSRKVTLADEPTFMTSTRAEDDVTPAPATRATAANATAEKFSSPTADYDDYSDAATSSTDAESVAARKSSGGSRALFIIPFVTVLREGLEAMVFLGGITISADPGSIPLAAACGILSGLIIGYIIYRAGNSVKLHSFFVCASIFLLFLSAGLAARAAISFEQRDWALHVGIGDTDAATTYNPLRTVWYLSCCRPSDPNQGGWQFLNAILGWSNVAYYSSVGVYIGYWVLVSAILIASKFGAFDGLKGFKAKAKKRMHDRRDAAVAGRKAAETA